MRSQGEEQWYHVVPYTALTHNTEEQIVLFFFNCISSLSGSNVPTNKKQSRVFAVMSSLIQWISGFAALKSGPTKQPIDFSNDCGAL